MMSVSAEQTNIDIARRWFDALNSGDLTAIDEILAPDVVDHSQLNLGHGGGAVGHKQLVDQLRQTFAEWESRIDDISANGDLVTIRHSGQGYYPGDMRALMGPQAADTPEIRTIGFQVTSTVRIKDGKIVEHWAETGPFGVKGKPAERLSDSQREAVARRWFDAVNSGDLAVIDEILASDVVDHSQLNLGHGGGAAGHKQLVDQLLKTFSEWESRIDAVEVNGDLVRVRHTGRGYYPGDMRLLMGPQAPDTPAIRKIDFPIVSTVRVDDRGKIVEHWAEVGPFGQKSQPGAGPSPTPGPTPGPWPAPVPGPSPAPTPGGPVVEGPSAYEGSGTPEDNKRFMRNYVEWVIDGQNPPLASHYFAQNFYNHDRAPGEETGLPGVTAFLESIFAAFSGFETTLHEQLAENDFVVGRWSQTFKNTGPYLGFPASGRPVNVAGITITRVRDGRILEEWEARDVLMLLRSMGVPSPLGPLEGGTPPGPSPWPPDQGIKDTARRYFYEIWDRGHVEMIDQVFSSDYVNHSATDGQLPGRDGIRQFVQVFRQAFPDVSISVDLQVEEGNFVATRYTVRGTHTGTFRGLQASNKPIEITGISVFRVEDGLIKESWGFLDEATLLAQIGQAPWSGAGGGGQPGGGGAQPGGGGAQPGGGGAQPGGGGQNW
jgi:steroid delta-isomerase-like uncharacterized protein